MSHATTMLEAIEAVLEGRVTADVEQYQIAGRSITKIPITELTQLRIQYKNEVAVEERAAKVEKGQNPGTKIKPRFNN